VDSVADSVQELVQAVKSIFAAVESSSAAQSDIKAELQGIRENTSDTIAGVSSLAEQTSLTHSHFKQQVQEAVRHEIRTAFKTELEPTLQRIEYNIVSKLEGSLAEAIAPISDRLHQLELQLQAAHSAAPRAPVAAAGDPPMDANPLYEGSSHDEPAPRADLPPMPPPYPGYRQPSASPPLPPSWLRARPTLFHQQGRQQFPQPQQYSVPPPPFGLQRPTAVPGPQPTRTQVSYMTRLPAPPWAQSRQQTPPPVPEWHTPAAEWHTPGGMTPYFTPGSVSPPQ
jgi:hypothetical protein